MKIKLKIYGFPRLNQIIGGKKVDIEFEGTTARDLICELIKIYGSEVHRIILDKNMHLNSNMRWLKNGNQWITDEDLDTELMDGDIIVLSLLVTGG